MSLKVEYVCRITHESYQGERGQQTVPNAPRVLNNVSCFITTVILSRRYVIFSAAPDLSFVLFSIKNYTICLVGSRWCFFFLFQCLDTQPNFIIQMSSHSESKSLLSRKLSKAAPLQHSPAVGSAGICFDICDDEEGRGRNSKKSQQRERKVCVRASRLATRKS